LKIDEKMCKSTLFFHNIFSELRIDFPPKFRSGITVSTLPAAAAAEFKKALNGIKRQRRQHAE
jgi:hypothetical protein